MGCCMSSGAGQILEFTDGGEEEYHRMFIEDEVLGEGEFGTVYLVHEVAVREASKHGKRAPLKMKTVIDKANEKREADCSSLACKTLRKGVQFKHNTVYAPMEPEILRREVEILRTLEGKHYNLSVYTVFESPKMIYLITELCSGGDMFQYVSRRETDLRIDEVSRISFQLLSAVDHCANCNIINRDIKPENIMFSMPAEDSPLRLIDFGAGTDRVVDGFHTTYAGTPFYISPEMFQESYTQKTDVWSAGVCLYVLVAGYPSEKLQTAFNIMHKIVDNNQNMKALPGMPDDMPESYYKMLKDTIEYKQKKRKTAGQILQSNDFVKFHTLPSSVHNANIVGSVGRHNLFLDYQKYERSLTTLLATMLTKAELSLFVKTVKSEIEQQKLDGAKNVEINVDEFLGNDKKEKAPFQESKEEPDEDKNKNLDIVTVKRVLEMLKEGGNDQVWVDDIGEAQFMHRLLWLLFSTEFPHIDFLVL